MTTTLNDQQKACIRALQEHLDESNGLLVAMMHEKRSVAEIEEQVALNRIAIESAKDFLGNPSQYAAVGAIPEGWKLVPIVPTRDMRQAGAYAYARLKTYEVSTGGMCDIRADKKAPATMKMEAAYAAMLENAPAAPLPRARDAPTEHQHAWRSVSDGVTQCKICGAIGGDAPATSAHAGAMPPITATGSLDEVKPAVDSWIQQRGTSMDGESYIAALQLAAYIKAVIDYDAVAHEPNNAFETLAIALGYPWLPCTICRGTEGCDHTASERARAALTATPAATAPAALTYPAEFNDELEWILGLICFQCISYAKALRAGGRAIPPKAEAEQAHTLDWMLRHYMRDPQNWRKNAADEARSFATNR